MNEARERILGRLRQGARRHALHGPSVSEREAEWLALQPPLGDLTDCFIAGQEAVGGKVIRVRDWEGLPEAVTPWMREFQVHSAMTGVLPRLEPLRRHLAEALGITVRTYSGTMEAQEEEIFSTDCGITLAHSGIADTGTVVLWPSPEEPRLLSLAMPVHLVLLERARIVGRMLDFIASQEYQTALPTNLVFATGASRTADIEQTLSIGVHGPKVFLVALIG
jgi:L-lactate dehydrogenase complex protein LldG